MTTSASQTTKSDPDVSDNMAIYVTVFVAIGLGGYTVYDRYIKS